MRFLIYSDVHFCETSSIVTALGNKYTVRLDNLINSINWAEEQAIINQCDEIICLGDFFNKPDLNSRELTALNELKWANCPHTFLIGNHDASDKSLYYNSVRTLQKLGFNIITEVSSKVSPQDNKIYLFLPYIVESDRKSINDYLNHNLKNPDIYIFSHNDIKGLQYGCFKSIEGFDVSEIENSCKLFINGHLHNGEHFCKNGINLGNLTGQNFSEDAFKYTHSIAILDTAENTIDFIENPYALNFYKMDFTGTNIQNISLEIKNNSVISIKCYISQVMKVNELLTQLEHRITQTRINILPDPISEEIKQVGINDSCEIIATDHLDKFRVFCNSNIKMSDLLVQELTEVCK